MEEPLWMSLVPSYREANLGKVPMHKLAIDQSLVAAVLELIKDRR